MHNENHAQNILFLRLVCLPKRAICTSKGILQEQHGPRCSR